VKTVLATHVWLDCDIPGYRGEDGGCRRLDRFLHHYQGCWPIRIIDNGSGPNHWYGISGDVEVTNAQPHYPRAGLLDYPAVWRWYWFIKDLLKEYDKVIAIATDAYILSQRLADYIEGLNSGWTALWSPKYNFPATEIQVITKHCANFQNFFSGNEDVYKYNGRIEELAVPLTHVEKGFVGDRYGEYDFNDIVKLGPKTPFDGDYYTQVPDNMDDAVFPVLRREDGKLVVK